MIENLLIYALVILIMYVLLGTRKHVGDATKEIHGNHARYKMQQMFGSDV